MVVAGGSVDATVGRAVEAGVVVKVAVVMDGTAAAADVLSAGIVTMQVVAVYWFQMLVLPLSAVMSVCPMGSW